jgi:hypothetical protein
VTVDTTQAVDDDQWQSSQPLKYAHLIPQRQPQPVITGSAKPLKDIVKKEINTYFSTNCATGRGEQVDIVKYWVNATVSTAQNLAHPVFRTSRTWLHMRYAYCWRPRRVHVSKDYSQQLEFAHRR